MTRRIAIIVTNVAHYADPGHPTGLWLAELTHALEVFEARGFETQLVSPRGGMTPLEPRSLRRPHADAAARAWLESPQGQARLAATARPDEVEAADLDAIYFTGGHAVMFDFPDDAGLQRLTRDVYERGGVVGAVCHGYCGLLNVRLSDGALLVSGRRLTGYSWTEEVLAGVAQAVPYDVEAAMKARGARYEKGFLPFSPKAVVDGRLVTGQNPASARLTAQQVAARL